MLFPKAPFAHLRALAMGGCSGGWWMMTGPNRQRVDLLVNQIVVSTLVLGMGNPISKEQCASRILCPLHATRLDDRKQDHDGQQATCSARVAAWTLPQSACNRLWYVPEVQHATKPRFTLYRIQRICRRAEWTRTYSVVLNSTTKPLQAPMPYHTACVGSVQAGAAFKLGTVDVGETYSRNWTLWVPEVLLTLLCCLRDASEMHLKHSVIPTHQNGTRCKMLTYPPNLQ